MSQHQYHHHQQQHQHQQAPPPPPPPPPPHNDTSSRASGLPPGNYDIFVIPPHSSGSGFVYLPSLQVQRNSFLAGAACSALLIWLGSTVVPQAWKAFQNLQSSSFAPSGMIIVCLVVGAGSWFLGKASTTPPKPGPFPKPPPNDGADSSGFNQDQSQHSQHHQTYSTSPPPNGNNYANTGFGTPPFSGTGAGAKPSWQRPPQSSEWEKAREEVRKAQEEKRRKDELEKKARELAEKEKWEKLKARENERREKEKREKEAADKAKKDKEAADAREAARLKVEEERKKAASEAAKAKTYQKPTAQSFAGTDDGYSFRPYDTPKRPAKTASQSSIYSESSYAASQSTSKTTPPPSQRGPWVNKDPDKITIKAVYLLTDSFPKPVAQLIAGADRVTQGLVLRMTTEGLFIDDDVRGVPQREWDVKAWTIKLVEEGDLAGKHILRACIRDAENKKYTFIIDSSEAYKVAIGLQRLRRGSQVRSLNVSGITPNECAKVLASLGWM